jgi:hypothetical protein
MFQPPNYSVTGALSEGVKRPGHEADNSHTPSAEVKNGLHGVVHN